MWSVVHEIVRAALALALAQAYQNTNKSEAAELTESEAAETQPAESTVKPESVEPADSAAGSDAVEPAIEPESAERSEEHTSELQVTVSSRMPSSA